MVTFRKASLDEIGTYRNQYLASIYEAQELYIEWLVRDSDVYIIDADETIGYFAVTGENILVEFYLVQSSIKDCENIFEQVIGEFKIEKALCKSFDSVFLKCCLKCSISHEVAGTLFRDFVPTPEDHMSEFLIREATEADKADLLCHTDGLYESESELDFMIQNRNISMYILDNELVGCGFIIKTLENREYRDIGMWVQTKFRNKGYATRIIANLKGYCLRNGMRPVCGCAVDNIASRKTLEKNGYYSKHDLIEYRFKV